MNPMWEKATDIHYCKIDQHHRCDVNNCEPSQWFFKVQTDDGHELGAVFSAISRDYETAHDAMMACDLFVEAVTQ